jgi:hypothetical protein
LWIRKRTGDRRPGLWGLDIHEGVLDENFCGRKWRVKVLSLDEAKEQARAMKDVQKEDKKSREDHKLMARFMDALQGKGDSCTKTQLRHALGWGLDRLNRICDTLLAGNAIEVVPDTVTAGKGAKRTVEMGPDPFWLPRRWPLSKWAGRIGFPQSRVRAPSTLDSAPRPSLNSPRLLLMLMKGLPPPPERAGRAAHGPFPSECALVRAARRHTHAGA